MPEIAEFLTSARRRLSLWLLLPLVAAVATVIVVVATSGAVTTYRTSAVVNTRSWASTPNDRLDLINDLSSIVTFPAVQAAAAAAAGIPAGKVEDAITVGRVGDSTLASVEFVTVDASKARARLFIDTLLTEAASLLVTPGTKDASSGPLAEILADQNSVVDKARTELDQYRADLGGVDPRKVAASIETEIVRREVLIASGSSRAGTLRQELKLLRGDLGKQQEAAAQYEELSSALAEALLERDRIREAIADRALASASTAPRFVATYSEVAVREDGGVLAIRRALAAGAGAGLLATGLLIPIHISRGRHHRAGRRRTP